MRADRQTDGAGYTQGRPEEHRRAQKSTEGHRRAKKSKEEPSHESGKPGADISVASGKSVARDNSVANDESVAAGSHVRNVISEWI